MSQKILLSVQVHRLLWLVGVIWKLHVKDTLLMGVGRKPKQRIDFVILLKTHLKLIMDITFIAVFHLQSESPSNGKSNLTSTPVLPALLEK